MHVLLHGNRHAARDGGVSPQLVGRINALLGMRRKNHVIEHVYFFATDVYPDGTRATDFVWERLTGCGFLPEQLTIEAIADTTHAEVQAFASSRERKGGRGKVAAVTSFYHTWRCAFLLRREGCDAKVIGARSFAFRDLILELPKLMLECTPAGQRLKEKIKARSPRLAA
ncbi:MAG: hypothetical protein AAB582_02840 [Patescibacteria group bacterium]